MGLAAGSLYGITCNYIGLDTVISYSACTSLYVCTNTESGMTLEVVKLFIAPKFTLTKQPLNIFNCTLYTISSNERYFIFTKQWHGDPFHKYDPPILTVIMLYWPGTIKKNFTDLRNHSHHPGLDSLPAQHCCPGGQHLARQLSIVPPPPT